MRRQPKSHRPRIPPTPRRPLWSLPNRINNIDLLLALDIDQLEVDLLFGEDDAPQLAHRDVVFCTRMAEFVEDVSQRGVALDVRFLANKHVEMLDLGVEFERCQIARRLALPCQAPADLVQEFGSV